jgi:hypothetical protein
MADSGSQSSGGRKRLPAPGGNGVTKKLQARIDIVTGEDATYLPDVGRVICSRIAKGDGLHAICEEFGMPPVSTVRMWAQDQDLPFGEMFQAACETAHSRWGEEILSLADEAAPNKDDIAKRKMQIDGRKWLLEKLNPLYARRSELTGRGGGPIAIVTRQMTDIELAREIAFMLEKPAGSTHAPLDLKAVDITDIEDS